MENLKIEIKQLFQNPKARIAIYVIIGLFAFVALGVAFFLTSNKQLPQRLSQDEVDNIIEEVIKNNSSSILAEVFTGERNTPETIVPIVQKEIATPSATPDLTKYNYRETIHKYTKGPAYDKCSFNSSYARGCGGHISGHYFIGDSYISTTTEYFEKTKSLSKTYSTDQDSTLFALTLSEYSAEKSESIAYRGGSYAIKTNTDAYPSYSNVDYQEIPASYTNYYNNYGELIRYETINGKEYILIEYSFKQFCNGGLKLPNNLDSDQQESIITIISKLYIDAKTFELELEETYLNSTEANNLISKSEHTSKKNLVKYLDVKDTFTFKENVELKEVNLVNYWSNQNRKEIDKSNKAFLSSKPIDLLVLDNYIMNDVYVYKTDKQSASYKLYFAREYYPNNEFGQKAYLKIQESYNIIDPEISIHYYRDVRGYSNTYSYVTLKIYHEDIVLNDLIDQSLDRQYSSYKLDNSEVKIDGVALESSKLSISYEYYNIPTTYNQSGISYPTSYSGLYPTNSWSQNEYYFEFGGTVYSLTYFGSEIFEFDKFDSEDINQLVAFYNQLAPVNVIYYYPTSYANYPESYTYY